MKYNISLSKTYFSKIKDIHVNWDIILRLGIVSIVFFSCLYVFQVNKLAKGYYLINKYEQTKAQLLEENKDLQISLAHNSVLDKIFEKVQSMNFQPNSSVKYIYILDDYLALRK